MAAGELSALEAVSETTLVQLERHAHAARGAFARNTERALRADTAVFTGWCTDQGLKALPADPQTVAAFIDALGEARAPATVRRYVSSIATLHRAAGLASPCEADAVRLALKRLHRARGRAQKQATALNRSYVDRMLAVPGPSLRTMRNRALLAVAYDTLARRSELVALQVADVEAALDGSAVVTIRRSKTDQEGEGSRRYLAPDTHGYLDAWLTAAGVAQEGALFRSVTKAGGLGDRLDPGTVARIFKEMATAAGLPPDTVARISGHSSRVGAAQDMVLANVELAGVMQAGDWRSAVMVGRYTAKIAAQRGGAAKLAMAQNRA
jgi:site-specific recombinase XerD